MRPEEALNQGRINLVSHTLTLCSIAFFPDAPAEGGLIPHGYGLVYGREAPAGALPPLILNKTPIRACWPVWPENQSFAGHPLETPGFQQVSWFPSFSGIYSGSLKKRAWTQSSQ